MPKVDFEKDASKLKYTDKVYMKRTEIENLYRVQILQKHRRKNNILGCALVGVAVATYAYTIYSMKQESFLDDFELPEATTQ